MHAYAESAHAGNGMSLAITDLADTAWLLGAAQLRQPLSQSVGCARQRHFADVAG